MMEPVGVIESPKPPTNKTEEEMAAIKEAEEEERARKEEEEAEEELRQQRFKRLMHLLKQSKFYTEFLVQKMAKRDEAIAMKSRKKKVSQPACVQQEDSQSADSRHLRERQTSKQEENPVKDASAVVRKRRVGSDDTSTSKRRKISAKAVYDISTVIDKETIQNIGKEVDERAGPSHVKEEISEDTRVTAYGHVVSVRQPLLFEGGVLRDYQLDALDWLKCLYENGMNGILADEMGLGKTLEVIALICHLIEMGNGGLYLIVAPLSTIPNWLIEFERFAPQIPVLLYHGNPDERKKVERQLSKKTKLLNVDVFPVLITSFEVPMRDKRVFQCRRWKYIVVDEGHRLKNPNSQLAKTLKSIACENRLLLTGTPLQNSIAELWALLNFLLPEIFDDLELFESWFSLDEVKDNSEKIIEQEEKNKIITTMHQILTPFLLRRTKADVAISIPPKKELIVYAPMTPLQRKLYESTVNCTIERLLQKEKDPAIEYGPDGKCPKRKCTLVKKRYSYADEYTSPSEESEEEPEPEPSNNGVLEIVDDQDKNYKVHLTMQNPSQQLRKIVNHPYLIQMPLKPGKNEIRVDEELIRKSGKLLVMDAMLSKLKARGHKVLIFSTFVMLLDLLEEYALYRKYTYCRLDGNTHLEDRKDRIKKFNTDPNIFLFLISTRAGGLGINLTAADTVIIFDSDWNPQVDLQAQDRCHRIGQTKPVVIYRLVTAGTYDEKIVERANAKRKLEKLIIQKDRFRLDRKNLRNLMSLQELRELLMSSDQRVVQPNGYVFTDAELDALLDRSDLMGGSADKPVHSNKKIFKKIEEITE
ncbi:lymphoid-specific helicase isoform X1 [Anabrus simplex]|uniref:lymphoid-specific helicase isoform X1 n=1 Tax=Anabrus simplex TaxID=316456 RepID=UPI0035A2CF5D